MFGHGASSASSVPPPMRHLRTVDSTKLVRDLRPDRPSPNAETIASARARLEAATALHEGFRDLARRDPDVRSVGFRLAPGPRGLPADEVVRSLQPVPSGAIYTRMRPAPDAYDLDRPSTAAAYAMRHPPRFSDRPVERPDRPELPPMRMTMPPMNSSTPRGYLPPTKYRRIDMELPRERDQSDTPAGYTPQEAWRARERERERERALERLNVNAVEMAPRGGVYASPMYAASPSSSASSGRFEEPRMLPREVDWPRRTMPPPRYREDDYEVNAPARPMHARASMLMAPRRGTMPMLKRPSSREYQDPEVMPRGTFLRPPERRRMNPPTELYGGGPHAVPLSRLSETNAMTEHRMASFRSPNMQAPRRPSAPVVVTPVVPPQPARAVAPTPPPVSAPAPVETLSSSSSEPKRRCGRKSMNYSSEQKRERNRAAVKKCRQRQALKLEYLRRKAQVLASENRALTDMLVKHEELDEEKRMSLTRGIQMDILLKIKEIFTQSLPKDFVLDADSIWDLNSVLAVSMPSRCYYGIESIKDFWRTSLRMRNKGKIRSFWAWLFRLPPGDRFSDFTIESFAPTSNLYFIHWTTKSTPPLTGSIVIMFGRGHRVTLHVEVFGWLIWRYLLTNTPFPEPPLE